MLGVGLRPQSTDKLIDSSMIVLGVGEKSMEPTNEDGEGDKNVDYAVRMRKLLDAYDNTEGEFYDNCRKCFSCTTFRNERL